MDLTEEYGKRANAGNDISRHMPILFAAALGGKTVIEFGVCTGNSTAAFLAAGADLWSVDASEPRVPAEWMSLPSWHFLQADDMSDECAEWLPAKTDVLFIDSDHTYEQATRELAEYAPRVKAGGIILLHDTQFQDNRDLGEPAGPVALAVGDFCAERKLRWFNHPGSFGLGIIPVHERLV